MTKYVRLFFTIVLGVTAFSARGMAQDSVTAATSALQDVLSNLKQSVEKLSLDNDQLGARDSAMKAEVLQLQMQLGNLQAQGDVLNKAAARLADKNPRRDRQVARLEEENSALDRRTQKAQIDIKLIQRSLDVGYQEDQKLLLSLKGLTPVLSAPAKTPSAESQLTVRRQKEKLKLMKMIYDSQQRQEMLHMSILKSQQNTPLLPAAGALAHQQVLKEQIKDLEAQMAAYSPEKPLMGSKFDQWNDAQVGQLEAELKILEHNYAQLKNLVEQMNKKAQNSRMTVSQRTEEEKLQGSIDDLNHQGAGLMADLDDLRSQMVDLDKRKSHLEMMIQHL